MDTNLLSYMQQLYSIYFLQDCLRIIDCFNDHDIKFCLSIAETFLNEHNKDPKKRMYYLKDKESPLIIILYNDYKIKQPAHQQQLQEECHYIERYDSSNIGVNVRISNRACNYLL
jgi:hypothetical protein